MMNTAFRAEAAMQPALPASDYYGDSASMTDIRVNSLTIPLTPSLVHMLDYKRIGEVAGRSLFPCLQQVDAVASGLAAHFADCERRFRAMVSARFARS